MPEGLHNAAGMTAGEIAQILRETYIDLYAFVREVSGGKLADLQSAPWEKLPASIKGRWQMAVERLFSIAEQGASVPTKSLTEQFLDTIAGTGTYQRQHRILRVLWEAVLRKGANLVTAGMADTDGGRPTSSEMRREIDDALKYNWRDWLADKLKKECAHAGK